MNEKNTSAIVDGTTSVIFRLEYNCAHYENTDCPDIGKTFQRINAKQHFFSFFSNHTKIIVVNNRVVVRNKTRKASMLFQLVRDFCTTIFVLGWVCIETNRFLLSITPQSARPFVNSARL